ncbi:MAG: DUF4388 domain-containing protein [Frankiales bacterium]|nr:DUF4388 domain-containing protein [Frankiales bacterium]
MNLEGSLDAFGLPDVFALLASTGKSGGLLLRATGASPQVEGVVWFREGRVSGASSDRSRASLVRRVVGSGAVDDAALRQAVARAAGGGIGVARALLEAGAVEPELLRQAATDQTVDAVFDLLRWPAGEFGFDQAAVDVDDVGVSLDHARVLAEAQARSEAWAQLEALVPSRDSVLAVPVVLHHDPEVSRDEWALLALVDGRRRVRDLVELTGAGQFAVTTTLAHLVQRGLLHVRDASTPDHVGVVERRLALLAPVEGGEVGAHAPAQAEPVVPALPDREHPVPAPAAATLPPGPGAQGITAAAALAAARAAQGVSAPAGAGALARPAARREVVPPRPEPFLPGRRPEHPEPGEPGHAARAATGTGGAVSGTAVEGATARALSEPVAEAVPEGVIERDPGVNRSLLLRLIAGVRGL